MASRPLRIALAASVALCLLACGEKSDEELLGAAKMHLGKRDFSAATVELKTYLQRKPNDGQGRLLLSRALLERGEIKAAELELNKARQAGLEEAELALWQARIWLATGKAKDLVQAYSGTVLPKKEDQADLRLSVATALFRIGRSKDGEAALQEVLAINPEHAGALLLQAKLAGAAGRIDDALTLAQRSIQKGAADGDAHRFRAEILLGVKNDLEGAIKEFELATADPMHEAAARAALIGALAENGRRDDAQAQLRLLKKKYGGSPGTLYAEAYLNLRIGELAAAKDVAAVLLRQSGDDARVLQLSAMIDLKRGELTSAAAKLSKTVALQGASSSGARKLLADAYLAMGDSERALLALRPLLEAQTRDPDALTRAGHALLLKGEGAASEAAYAEAARMRPNDASIGANLALFDLARGQTEKGYAALNAIAASDKGVVADMALISAHMRRREFDAALAAIAKLEGKQASTPSASHLRGEALKAKGDRTAARAAYEAALKLDPAYIASGIALAVLELDEGKVAAARQRLDAIIEAKSASAQARLLRLKVMELQGVPEAEIGKAVAEAVQVNSGDAATRLYQIEWLTNVAKDLQAALSAAQAAQAQFPDHPAVLDAVGRAYLNTRDMALANSAFEKMRSLLPNSVLPHLRLAELHQRQGNAAAMQNDLSRAFDLEPRSKDVRRRLLRLAAQDRGAEFVTELARRAQKQPAGVSVGLVLEGDVQVTRKRLEPALVLYRAAAKRPEADAEAASRVLDTLVALGKDPEARAFADGWVKDHPRDAAFIEHAGELAMLRNDMPGSEKWFSLLVKLTPDNGSAQNNLSMVLARRGAPEAVAAAERALLLLPGQAAVLDTYARALASQKRLPEAIAAQKRALAALPGDPSYRMALAELHLQAGDKPAALADLEVVAAMGSKFPGQARVAALKQLASAK